MKTKVVVVLMLGLCSLLGRAQVGINTESPDVSSMFDVVSSDKGILIPRVKLTSATMDLDGIPGQAKGLMVFNISTEMANGFYFWNGSEWRIMDSSSSTLPNIKDLLCAGAVLSPSSYQAGVPYSGVMKVPYTGGNGGAYSASEPITIHGLTITLQAGQLQNGAGDLSFMVEGLPDISTPEGVVIPINGSKTPHVALDFWSGDCEVKVGDQANADIRTIAVMDYMRFTRDADTGAYGFTVECKTPDGLYTVRVFLKHSNQTSSANESNNTELVASGVNNNVQLRNNSEITKTIMWNYSTFYGALINSAGGNLKVPAKIFGGGQGNSWTSSSTSIQAPWGDAGIYNAVNAGPEYRYYSWIDTSASSKVSYYTTIMSGMDPSARGSDALKQKVFIKIEQITAI